MTAPTKQNKNMNSLDNLRTQAHVAASSARQAADDANSLALWISCSDEERDQARSFPWLGAHVAKMDKMVSEMENGIKFLTGPTDGATHVIDDGGMIYWTETPGKTNDEIAAEFRRDYDGELGAFDVTTIEIDDKTVYDA